MKNEDFILQCLNDALTALEAGRPVSAGPTARLYAIVIANLRQVIAFFAYWIMQDRGDE